nr:hypothetical protein JVH1_9248 [Rhodococcus sp. JVH1]
MSLAKAGTDVVVIDIDGDAAHRMVEEVTAAGGRARPRP